MTDDTALIRLLQDQPEKGFDAIHAAYGRKIYTLAYRMTGNREDAEDVTQETFIQVIRYIGQFRGESALYTWVYTIARNQCHRLLKQRNKSSFASMESLLHSVGEMPKEPYPDRERRILLNQIKEGCLTGLLRCLPFSQRMAFILHVLLHLPVKEISKILRKSEGAVKVLVHRARRNLKTFLCRNCSLYDSSNPCRCENFIRFSLAQGWIQQPAGEPWETVYDVSPEMIQAEIAEIRKVTELYTSMAGPAFSETLHRHIREMIQNQSRAIFLFKKV